MAESAEATVATLSSATEVREIHRTEANDSTKDTEEEVHANGAASGHQYATCDDTEGWRMHEPSLPWTDGILKQKRTPAPVDNIPR